MRRIILFLFVVGVITIFGCEIGGYRIDIKEIDNLNNSYLIDDLKNTEQEYRKTKTSSVFDVEIISLDNENLEYELSFKQDVNIHGFWITFVSEEGEEYKWDCWDIVSCRIERFMTRGIKRKMTSEFDSSFDDKKGTINFYINVESGNMRLTKHIVEIKYNP